MRNESLLGLFLLSFILLAAAQPSSAAEIDPFHTPTQGDAIVTASIGEPSTLVPVLASDAPSHDICGLIFNTLVKYDRDIQLVGDLAERWEVREGGLEILFFLKRGVRWHDGAPFTAADVQFTYERHIDPKVPTPYRSDFDKVVSLEVLDDYTVRVRYKEPFAPAVSGWAKWIMPKHLLDGENLMRTPFKEHPIGTGPFRFHRWIRGDRIELTANPDYFEGRPYIDWYVYRIIPDQGTIFLELQAQGLDQGGLTPLQYERMTDTPHFTKAFRKFRYPSLGYTYMGYNLKDPRFADIRVRQAFNLAINKQEIIGGVLLGLGEISTGPFPKKSWAYNPKVQPPPYDPGAAKALLTQAGWKDANGDGLLERAGQTFSFTLLTNQGNRQRLLTAQIIARRLRAVGIEMKIRVIEWATFIDEFINKRRFEAVLLGWGLSWDPDPYDIWHSSKTGEGEFNFLGYANPKADQLIAAGRATFSKDKRRRLYQEFHELLYQDQPVCFLYVADSLPAIHQRYQQVEVSPYGGLFNLIHWYVPESRQRYRLTA